MRPELLIWFGAVFVAALSLWGLVNSFCYLWKTRERPDESEAVIAYCEKKIREAIPSERDNVRKMR